MSLSQNISRRCDSCSRPRTSLFRSTLAIALGAFCSAVTFFGDRLCEAGSAPNVLFILTDDQGWSSLSCYGSGHVPTPNLDRLAAQGIRFTDAYVMPQCTPTRAALLTGRHTAVNRMWHVIGWYGSPWAPVSEPLFQENLPPQECRLPHMLRDAGYTTGMGGKWHLTTNGDGHYTNLKPHAADKYGFDVVAPRGPGSQNEGDKWVNHLTDHAIDFIRGNRNRPWFYYLSHHTIHGVVTAPDDLIQKHLSAGAPAVGLQNATYLAALEHMDHSIGRLMTALDETGQRENTLVVFLSDNGGVDTSYQVPSEAAEFAAHPLRLRIRDQQFESAPLRAGKGSIYEGGIRVPCIVRWPAVIQSGRVDSTPVHVVDWLPTLVSAAGTSSDQSHDGIDLTGLMRGETVPQRSLYWYAPLYDLRWAFDPGRGGAPWGLEIGVAFRRSFRCRSDLSEWPLAGTLSPCERSGRDHRCRAAAPADGSETS